MEVSATIEMTSKRETAVGGYVAIVAWVVASTVYFYQYALRSSPSVMMPELSNAFGLSALGVATIVGFFYYGYAPFSIVAGVVFDRMSLRIPLTISALVIGIGAALFASGNPGLASVGRFLQGAAGVFATVGALYIASHYFSPSRTATMTGATQMFGMAGGSAGQFAVGPLIAGGLVWSSFWLGMGVVAVVLAVLLFLFVPRAQKKQQRDDWLMSAFHALKVVFSNPQSILCGLISGLLFIPTTIFDMVWGVRYLQEAHGMEYGSAVMHSATVPLGWIIGCPLLGFISDRIGRRRPVIISGAFVLMVCLAWILFGPKDVLPPYTLGLVAGIASGSAMVPYTVIKEVNPPEFGGTATGVINFLNFSFSALLGPVFGWTLQSVSGGATAELEHYQIAFVPLLYGVALVLILALFLKETGPAGRAKSGESTLEV
jgi:MFS family permease